MTRIDVAQAAALLAEKQRILILAHDHPDGDTLGCGYALCRILRGLGKQAEVKCGDTIPDSYAFMWDSLPSQDFEPDFTVAVDIADPKLLGPVFEQRYTETIDLCIDHHGSNKFECEYVLLQSDAAAVAEIIYDLLVELNADMTPAIADCLFTALSTDTGCFRYTNTTARSHRVAAMLMDAGANTGDIIQTFFETKSKAYALLERMALDSLQLYFDDRCAVITMTQEMFRLSQADDSETDRISALPRQIEGVKIGVTMREMKDGSFKVSLRTNNPLNAAVLAGKMGGGGHLRAAGCRLDGPYETALKTLLDIIGEELSG